MICPLRVNERSTGTIFPTEGFYQRCNHQNIFWLTNTTARADNNRSFRQINATGFSFFIATELDVGNSVCIN